MVWRSGDHCALPRAMRHGVHMTLFDQLIFRTLPRVRDELLVKQFVANEFAPFDCWQDSRADTN